MINPWIIIGWAIVAILVIYAIAAPIVVVIAIRRRRRAIAECEARRAAARDGQKRFRL